MMPSSTTRRPHSLLLAILFAALTALGACGGDSGGGGGGGADAGDDTTDNDGSGDPDSGDCTAGTDGCECTDDGTCNDGLVCNADDICEIDESCEPGDTGCQCLGDGTCSDASDACDEDNVCSPRTDCTGELACACGDGDACDGDLVCEDGICTVENALLIELEGGDARACDILVDTPDLQASEVVFPAGVRGRHRARGARTAIALIRTEDAQLAGPVAAVVFEEGAEVDADAVGALSATCYGRLGGPEDSVTPSAR